MLATEVSRRDGGRLVLLAAFDAIELSEQHAASHQEQIKCGELLQNGAPLMIGSSVIYMPQDAYRLGSISFIPYFTSYSLPFVSYFFLQGESFKPQDCQLIVLDPSLRSGLQHDTLVPLPPEAGMEGQRGRQAGQVISQVG